MTNSLFSYDDEACQSRLIDPWDEDAQYAPTPGDFGRTPATLYSLSPTPDPISCQSWMCAQPAIYGTSHHRKTIHTCLALSLG